jgi:hypothetical protein
MKATDCLWHRTCRYQQKLYRSDSELSGVTPPCWADFVKCRDERSHMEKHCRLFLQRQSEGGKDSVNKNGDS